MLLCAARRRHVYVVVLCEVTLRGVTPEVGPTWEPRQEAGFKLLAAATCLLLAACGLRVKKVAMLQLRGVCCWPDCGEEHEVGCG